MNESQNACTIIACVWFGAVVCFINGAWFTVRAVTVWIYKHKEKVMFKSTVNTIIAHVIMPAKEKTWQLQFCNVTPTKINIKVSMKWFNKHRGLKATRVKFWFHGNFKSICHKRLHYSDFTMDKGWFTQNMFLLLKTEDAGQWGKKRKLLKRVF